MSDPERFPEAGLEGLVIHPAGVVDARRDLHLFLRYVEERGLRRTVRSNCIPKADAVRLAKACSYAAERREVRERGSGLWMEHVSWLAREMGLVSFDAEGIYAGYTSTVSSYPDNDVMIARKALRLYLAETPAKKERAILRAHLTLIESEFFEPALLLPSETFDSYGSATGPAGRMDLPRIRECLLEYFAALEPGVWYDLPSTVADFAHRHPRLILSSADGPEKWDSGDLYRNFRESPAGASRWGRGRDQITTSTPEAFRRVEGRYLEFFLRGIPYLLGFVALAERPPGDPHGLDVTPPRERIRAFQVTPRLAAIVGGDEDFGRVQMRVLPDFEVVVETPSHPETVLTELELFADPLREEGSLYRYRIRKNRVVKSVADSGGGLDPVARLEALAGRPLPGNVAAELASWSRRGESFTIYEGFAILETGGEEERRRARGALKDLLLPEDAGKVSLVREPDRAFERLEQAGLVPNRVRHRSKAFAPSSGLLGGDPGAPATRPSRPAAPPLVPAELATEDTVALRSDRPELIEALAADLGGAATPLEDGRLLIPATMLPALRSALRRLGKRFRITRR